VPAAETTPYTGALDGLEGKVSLPDFDPVQWTMTRHANAPMALTYKPANKRATEAWQKKLRVKVQELIGGFPKNKTALQPVTLEVKDFPGYRNFIVRSSPHTHVAGYRMPLFVFAAEDDENTPFADTKAFTEQLKAAKKDVTFDHVATGNHYEPMLDPGIPHAIAWAQKLAAAPAAAPAAPKPPKK
jgi:acetyl esterase/lipase